MMGRSFSSMPIEFQTINGLQQLAETRRFKAWFLDQFGVLHDGKQPYPGAISTLEKLANYGTKMVIISNSSRRASTTFDKLRSLGFDTSLFVGAITSGELAHEYLLRRDDPWFTRLGRSCIHMTWNDRGAISLEGLDLQVVDNVEEAEFILAHGTEALGLPSGAALSMMLEDLEKILEQCVAKKIPMVVANPDFVTVEARALRVMPGTLAATYEKLGGEVKWMGKPGEGSLLLLSLEGSMQLNSDLVNSEKLQITLLFMLLPRNTRLIQHMCSHHLHGSLIIVFLCGSEAQLPIHSQYMEEHRF
ncbi:uncharacterized protein LOC111396159 isoform X2 [Olea europaea var. sylvestris]|uniref:uncharacterized protein LOC111396159 isoform X2 n=1 Tax=Olea europaea var. sylvestris TaxID=158386 RepID=UPI000C1D728B|nr:uncharacterized protein LOC111396159 isoform X2 [Olea europaea var. sylvestris]